MAACPRLNQNRARCRDSGSPMRENPMAKQPAAINAAPAIPDMAACAPPGWATATAKAATLRAQTNPA